MRCRHGKLPVIDALVILLTFLIALASGVLIYLNDTLREIDDTLYSHVSEQWVSIEGCPGRPDRPQRTDEPRLHEVTLQIHGTVAWGEDIWDVNEDCFRSGGEVIGEDELNFAKDKPRATDGLVREGDFDTDPTERLQELVRSVGRDLRDNGPRRIYVIGHTDDERPQAWDERYNEELSYRRARWVVNHLRRELGRASNFGGEEAFVEGEDYAIFAIGSGEDEPWPISETALPQDASLPRGAEMREAQVHLARLDSQAVEALFGDHHAERDAWRAESRRIQLFFRSPRPGEAL